MAQYSNIRHALLFLTTITLLTSCVNQETKSPTSHQPQSIDSVALFIDLFPEINAEDLHVYSPGDTLTTDKFKGKQIATSFYRFLKFDNNVDPFLADTLYHFYSCFQFKMTDTKIGLLIRRPSQYSETAIDLYTWDNSQKKVVDIINLTDAFGDEGWYFVQDAWLKDLNRDKTLDIITRRKDFDQDLEDSTKISRKDSVFVFFNNGTTFKITNFKLDTSKFQLKYWTDK